MTGFNVNKEGRMDLTRLQAAVERDNTVNQSAITLLATLAEELRKVAGDPAAVNALADQLDASQQSLADAVTANTPAGGGITDSTSSEASPRSKNR